MFVDWMENFPLEGKKENNEVGKMCRYCDSNILDALAINSKDEAVIINQDTETGEYFIDGLDERVYIDYCPMCRKEAGKVKHIVSFSGGKDSTAMLLKMIENNMQIDEIIFCDTGKEFPQMYEHIKKVEQYINRKITILKAEKSFDYYMFEHKKTKGKNKGQAGYGWASGRCRWCTTLLKNNVINKYLRKYKDEGYKEYVGIAYDEQERIKDKNYPLVDWQMTEKDCLEYCYSKGFNWEGLYEHLDRVSCWCCPLKKIKEYKVLYTYYPNLWNELKGMDKKANNRFRKDYTVEELEEKFKEESYDK